MSESTEAEPVRAKAALVDPGTMSVLWANEAAEPNAPRLALEQAIPLAEQMGVAEAIRSVAHTGVPGHMRTSLVSTGRGDVAIATSVYRLPGGLVLVLSERAWQPSRDSASGGASRGHSRRNR